MIKDEHFERRVKVIDRTSASQVTTFERCKRRWFNESVAGHRPPPSTAQAKGIAIHSALEHYLETGEIIPCEWAPFVKASKEHLPAPRSDDLLLEHEIRMPTYPSGPEWLGFIDCVEIVNEPEGVFIRIFDHKTTSNLSRRKSSEDLLTDVQMTAYAHWAYAHMNAHKVELLHNNILTKGNIKTILTSTFISREQVDERWKKSIDSVRIMVDIATNTKELDDIEIPKGVGTKDDPCWDFGGCPHRARCKLDQFSIFNAASGNVSGNVFDNNIFANEGNDMSDLMKRLQESIAAQQEKTQAQPPAAPSVANGTAKVPMAYVPVETGVLPPDAPSRTSSSEDVEVANAPKTRGKAKKSTIKCGDCGEKVPIEGFEVHVEAMHPKDTTATTTTASSIKCDRCGEIIPVENWGTHFADKHGKEEKPVETTTESPALTLYIDCVVAKTYDGFQVAHLEEWLAPIATAVAAAANVADWRQIKYTAKGDLAVGIRDALPTLPPALYIDSRQSGADVALEVLVPHAVYIIRGLR